jgi:hypothetical protein
MGGVEDDAYAEQLLAILTNPDPSGIDPDDPSQQADDGIDRYGGFGRDVWVESAVVVDGPHGAELAIGFGMDLRDEQSLEVPRTGSLRLPLDATWRELSGYIDPAAYAPEVARRVEVAAAMHVVGYTRGAPQGVLPVPSRLEQWQVLLDALRGEGDVQQVAPGRIELRYETGPLVTLVMTADEWERVYLKHASGDIQMYVTELLGPRQEDETFVVVYGDDLARSTREELPPVRGRAIERRHARLRDQHPDAKLAWYAHPHKPNDPPEVS